MSSKVNAVVATNYSGTMDAETISKNGASSKSQMSREKTFEVAPDTNKGF